MDNTEENTLGDLTKTKTRSKSKCGSCCIYLLKSLKHSVVSFVLTSVVIGYVVAGGLLFYTLEYPAEKERIAEMSALQITFLGHISNKLKFVEDCYATNRTRLPSECAANTTYRSIVDEFGRYESQMHDLLGYGAYNEETKEVTPKWTIAGSFLYSTSVITTIGYGSPVPATVAGKGLTILYAIIGIPLMLFALTTLGGWLGQCVRWLYTHMCTTQRTDQQERTIVREVPIIGCLVLIGSTLFGISLLFKLWEGWNWLDAIYFCFITFSTIGFGDIVPGEKSLGGDTSKPILCALSVYIGLIMVSTCFTLMQSRVQETVGNCSNKIKSLCVTNDTVQEFNEEINENNKEENSKLQAEC